MNNLLSIFYKTLQTWVLNAIEPHPSIKDREDRYRSKILNSLFLLYIPVAVFAIFFRVFLTPGDVQTTQIITSVGLFSMGIIYRLGRSGYYQQSLYIIIIVGFALIYFNAVNSSPPHLEIIYLIFMPLLGMMLFSIREVLGLFVLSTVLTLVFLSTMEDIERNIAIDIFMFILMAQAFIFFASVQRDRLEEKRHQLALEREHRAISSRMVSYISHDFRTPLSVINTSIYLIRRVNTPERLEKGLQTIEKEANRLEQLVEDMILMSKLDFHRIDLEETVNLVEIVEQTIVDLQPIIQAKNISLRSSLQGNNYLIVGSTEELKKVVMNLTQNAVEYTPPDGSINISLESSDDTHVAIKVQDTGIGISPEDLPYIFDHFYRAEKFRPAKNGIGGLGLAIVKSIVERHHGNIAVQSQLGTGTTFTIQLPRVREIK